MAEDDDDVVPYCVAAGDVGQLVNFFTSRGQLVDATTVAQSASEGFIIKPIAKTSDGNASASSSERDKIEREGER